MWTGTGRAHASVCFLPGLLRYNARFHSFSVPCFPGQVHVQAFPNPPLYISIFILGTSSQILNAFLSVLVQSVLHADQSGGSAILVLEHSCLQTFLTLLPKGAD